MNGGEGTGGDKRRWEGRPGEESSFSVRSGMRQCLRSVMLCEGQELHHTGDHV